MAKRFWLGLFLLCIVLLALLAASIPFVETGSATFIVAQLAALHLFAAMAILSALIYFDWNPLRKMAENREN